jgi:hypothetical protein
LLNFELKSKRYRTKYLKNILLLCIVNKKIQSGDLVPSKAASSSRQTTDQNANNNIFDQEKSGNFLKKKLSAISSCFTSK